MPRGEPLGAARERTAREPRRAQEGHKVGQRHAPAVEQAREAGLGDRTQEEPRRGERPFDHGAGHLVEPRAVVALHGALMPDQGGDGAGSDPRGRGEHGVHDGAQCSTGGPPRGQPPGGRSDQGGFQHDAAVHHPRRAREQGGDGLGRPRAPPRAGAGDRSSRRMARIRSPSWPPNDSSTMARPVVVARRPAEHRGHEAGGEVHRHAEPPLPLGLATPVRQALERVQPAGAASGASPGRAAPPPRRPSATPRRGTSTGRPPRPAWPPRARRGSTISATSSSLSWRRAATSWPLGRSLPPSVSRSTAWNRSSTSTTARNSCQ